MRVTGLNKYLTGNNAKILFVIITKRLNIFCHTEYMQQ